MERIGECGALVCSLLLVVLIGCVATRPVGDLAGRDTYLCFAEVNGRLHPFRVYFPHDYEFVEDKQSPSFRPFPLLILCHSVGLDENAYFQWKGNEDRIQTIAEERGYIVACPAAPDRSWHNYPGEKDREVLLRQGGICKPESVDIIMEVLREMAKHYWIDDDRVYLAGASSGAIATYETASRNPEGFAAVAGVCGGFTDELLQGLSKVPVLMFNAQKDTSFPIDIIRWQKEKLEVAGGTVVLHEVPGGHGSYRNLESYEVLFDFFDQHKRKSGR